MPSSIAKTFALLKDIEYADDISNNNNNSGKESSTISIEKNNG